MEPEPPSCPFSLNEIKTAQKFLRYALCALPLVLLCSSIVWADRTSSKVWISLVGSLSLVLNIVLIIVSAGSVAFMAILIAGFMTNPSPIVQLYHFTTLFAFIICIVLLTTGTTHESIVNAAELTAYCVASPRPPSARVIAAEDPTQSLDPGESGAGTPCASDTPAESPLATPSESIEMTLVPSASPDATIPVPSPTPWIDPALEFYSFCEEHWTDWSRRRFVRERTTDRYRVHLAILGLWAMVWILHTSAFVYVEYLAAPATANTPEV
jgi:hypothetical protein